MAASHRRVNGALPFQLGNASRRKERESNPQGRGPPVFETGYRARWQSFQQVTPAGLEPARPRLRVGRSTELSYGAREMWSAGVEPARPAFQAGALPDWSYDHRWAVTFAADAGTCRRRPTTCRIDSDAERSHHGSASAEPDFARRDGRGWNRTSVLLFVRQALGLSELLARALMGGAGIEPASSSVSERCSAY